MSTDHGKENDTGAPKISLWPNILQTLDQLGRCVARRATRRGQLLTRFIHIAESEIDHFQIELLIEKQVLRLNISVNDS